jgi:hypothetical protein
VGPIDLRRGAPARGKAALVLAVVGALAGLAAPLVAWERLPQSPVQVAWSETTWPTPRADLSVKFFGRPGYTKTAADATWIEVEAEAWGAAPLLLALGTAWAGGWAGWKAGALLGRRPGVDPAKPGCSGAAADYDDAPAAEPGGAPDRGGGK